MKDDFKAIAILFLVFYLLAVLSTTALAQKVGIEPVTIWVALPVNTIQAGEKTNAFIFLENPFEQTCKFEIEVKLISENEEQILFVGVIRMEAFNHSEIILQLSPPAGDWKVTVTSVKLKPRPKYRITNSANLSVQ